MLGRRHGGRETPQERRYGRQAGAAGAPPPAETAAPLSKGDVPLGSVALGSEAGGGPVGRSPVMAAVAPEPEPLPEGAGGADLGTVGTEEAAGASARWGIGRCFAGSGLVPRPRRSFQDRLGPGAAGGSQTGTAGRRGLCMGGGGWIFGHLIDGLQAEYARVPFADTSVYKVPAGLSDEQVLFLADILPTAYEVGILNGRVEPGDTVVVVGVGPIGLATIMTAKLHTPGKIVAVDLADARLAKAIDFGADIVFDSASEDVVARVMEMTDGLGQQTSRSRPSEFRRHSSSARSSFDREAASPMSAFTGTRRRFISRSSGSGTCSSRRAWSTRRRRRSCSS